RRALRATARLGPGPLVAGGRRRSGPDLPVGPATAPGWSAALGVRPLDLGGHGLGRRGRLPADGVGPLPAPDPCAERAAGCDRYPFARGPLAREGGGCVSRTHVAALGVFLISLGSYAFFWHSRDWNTGSRLMLTYAMVDRGTVAITGLERQT